MPSKRPAPLSDAMFKPAGPSGPPTSAAPEPQTGPAPALAEAVTNGLLGATFNGAPLPVKNTFIDVPSGYTPSGMKSASLAKAQPVMTAPADLSLSGGFIKRAIMNSVPVASSGTSNGVAPAQSPMASRRAALPAFQGTPLSTPSPTTSLMGFSAGTMVNGVPAAASSSTGPSGFPACVLPATSLLQAPQATTVPQQLFAQTSVASASTMAPAMSLTAPAPSMPFPQPGPMSTMALTAPAPGAPLMSAVQAPAQVANLSAPASAQAPVRAVLQAGAQPLQQSPRGTAPMLQPVQYTGPVSVLGGPTITKPLLLEEVDDDEDDDDDGEDVPPHLRNPADAPQPPPGAIHPSIGSEAHLDGACKRCCFYPRGRCTNGYNCEFCHYEHEKRKRKNKKKKKKDPGAAAAAASAAMAVAAAPTAMAAAPTGPNLQMMPRAPPLMPVSQPQLQPRPEPAVFATAPPAQPQPPELAYAAPVVQNFAQPPQQVTYVVEAPPAPPAYAVAPQVLQPIAEAAPTQLGLQGFPQPQYTAPPPATAPAPVVLASAPPQPLVPLLLSSSPAPAPVLRTAPAPPPMGPPTTLAVEAVGMSTQPRPAPPAPPALAPAQASAAGAAQAFMPPAPLVSPKLSKGPETAMPPPMLSPKLAQGGLVFDGPMVPPPQASPRFPRNLAQEVQQAIRQQMRAAGTPQPEGAA